MACIILDRPKKRLLLAYEHAILKAKNMSYVLYLLLMMQIAQIQQCVHLFIVFLLLLILLDDWIEIKYILWVRLKW